MGDQINGHGAVNVYRPYCDDDSFIGIGLVFGRPNTPPKGQYYCVHKNYITIEQRCGSKSEPESEPESKSGFSWVWWVLIILLLIIIIAAIVYMSVRYGPTPKLGGLSLQLPQSVSLKK